MQRYLLRNLLPALGIPLLAFMSVVISGSNDIKKKNETAVTGSSTQVAPQLRTRGPHGGRIVSDDHHQFEVTINPRTGIMDVYANRLQSTPPGSLSITLYKDTEVFETIEAQAIDLRDPVPHYQAKLAAEPKPRNEAPQHQGRLTETQDSYMNIGITFRVAVKSQG